jgi:hypothetical protein
MTKCDNCQDYAEHALTWPVTGGHQSANLCGCCSAMWWDKYAHTPSGQGVTILPVDEAE